MQALLFFLLVPENLKKYHKGDFAGHCSIYQYILCKRVLIFCWSTFSIDVTNNRAAVQPEDVRLTEINSSGFSHAVTTTSQAGSGSMFQGHYHGTGLN